MANLSSTSTTVLGGGAVNSTFANSKFFLKRQNRAAIKIQAIGRSFLVQARIFRQRVLEPRMKDLQDCQTRQLEELRRIQQQKDTEMKELPTRIKTELEDTVQLVANLKQEIADFERDNEELKQQRKEVKRQNKELEAESAQLKEDDFRLRVRTTQWTKENSDLQHQFDQFKEEMDEWTHIKTCLDADVVKAMRQQAILKKYIAKIIKAVDEKAGNTSTSSSSRSKSSSPPASPKKPTNRRKSLAKSLSKKKMALHDSESAGFNWASHSHDWSKNPIVLEDEEDAPAPASPKKSTNRRKSKKPNKSPIVAEHVEEGSFNNQDLLNGSSSSKSDSKSDGAAFDWATKSYNNFGNQSIELNDVNNVHQSTTSGLGKIDATTGNKKERRQRRHSEHPMSSKLVEKGSSHHHTKSRHHHHHTSKNGALSDLVSELKSIKH